MDSLNETVLKSHNLIATAIGSSESEENGASHESELPESPCSEPTCKKLCEDALLHSDMERMRRERIKDCCDRLRVLLPYVKGRRTDVASILEMAVEYLRYIYGRIPNNVISQIIEIFQTNTRYCKYVWKPNDPPKQRIGLTPRMSAFMGDTSEKVKPNVQFASHQYTENEYFNNRKAVAASHMNYATVHHEAALGPNQYCIPTTETLVPHIQTNTLPPSVPPLFLFPTPHDVQNVCFPNLANVSMFPSTDPNSSYPIFTDSSGRLWSSSIARPNIGPPSLLSSCDCLGSSSTFPSDYSVNPFSIISTPAAQTVGRNVQLSTIDTPSSLVNAFNGTNQAPTSFSAVCPAKPLLAVWTNNGEQPGTEERATLNIAKRAK